MDSSRQSRLVIARFGVLPSFLKIAWRAAPLLCFWVIIIKILGGLVPYLTVICLKRIIDIISYSIFMGKVQMHGIVTTFILLIFIQVVSTLLGSCDLQFQMLMNRKISNYVEELIMQKTVEYPYENLRSSSVQDLLFFLRSATPNKPADIIMTLLNLISSIISGISMLSLLLSWNAMLGVVIIVAAVPLSLVQVYLGKKQYDLAQRVAPFGRENYYYTYLLSAIQSLREILSYGASLIFIKRHNKVFQSIYKEYKRFGYLSITIGVVSSLLASGVMLYIQFRLIISAVSLQLSIGSVTALFQAISSVWTSTQSIVTSIASVYSDLLYAHKLLMFVNLNSLSVQSGKLVIVSPNNQQETDEVEMFKSLKLNNISYSYEGKTLMQNISLEIKPGSRIGITGENGSGKTTLCEIMLGLRTPTEGNVHFNGIEDDMIKPKRLNYCSPLFQDYTRYELTYLDNITVSTGSSSNKDDSRVFDYLSSLESQITLPLNKSMLSSRLGEWFEYSIQLSGGQWQKVALFRTLYKNASIYILDEPTSSLDVHAVVELTNVLNSIPPTCAVITVSHNMEFLEQTCTEIYYMSKGALIPNQSPIGVLD